MRQESRFKGWGFFFSRFLFTHSFSLSLKQTSQREQKKRRKKEKRNDKGQQERKAECLSAKTNGRKRLNALLKVRARNSFLICGFLISLLLQVNFCLFSSSFSLFFYLFFILSLLCFLFIYCFIISFILSFSLTFATYL